MQTDHIKNIGIWSLLALSLPFLYQNCGRSDARLSIDRGVRGGSLSLTTSSSAYDYNYGRIDSEITNYDDLYHTTSIELLNPFDERLPPLTSRITSDQKFIITVTNGAANRGIILQINGHNYLAERYAQITKDFIDGKINSFPTYTLKSLKGAKLLILKDAFTSHKMVQTRLDCVTANRPGPKGEYRNGALVIQVIGTESLSFDTTTFSAGRAAKLLWEIAIFQNSPQGHCH